MKFLGPFPVEFFNDWEGGFQPFQPVGVRERGRLIHGYVRYATAWRSWLGNRSGSQEKESREELFHRNG
ncbi:hypothetical protein GCM10028774_08110 [Spirosoma jeollabukense]